jgi:two-component system, LytTR family, response regulator
MTSVASAPAAAAAGPIRVLIVDDETAARRRLVDLLALEPDIAVIGESRDGLQAIADIRHLAPDLVFLDVEMPERNGLQVVSEIGLDAMPPTIFVTAYDRYAVAAFDADVMDYLLKPFDAERLARALARARSWLQRADDARPAGQRVARLEAALTKLGRPPGVQDRFLVRVGDSRQFVRSADILFIEADGNHVVLHTAGERFALRERMVGMLERLDPALFRRIHRSHIVNLDHVRKLLPWFGGDRLVIMANGSRLTLSRTFRTALDPL